MDLPQNTPLPPVTHSNWAALLQKDSSLTPALRESYRLTISRFLQFCRSRPGAASVATAREYVEVTQLQQAPGPARLQEWKDGLNWYFLARSHESSGHDHRSPDFRPG